MLSTFMRQLFIQPMHDVGTQKHVVKHSSFFRLFCVHHIFYAALLMSMMLVTGCSTTPTSVIEQPSTARAPVIEPPAKNSGAIYNSRGHRPLFEDRKPRGVGDIVNINIRENTVANKSVTSGGAKDGEIDASVTSLFGKEIPSATIGTDASTSYSDSTTANASNLFNGSITTTVIEVLPNGYYLVSGEKQISLDKGTEYVRFSGVVNPDTITIGNNVNSTQVADARIEYRTAAKIDAAEIANAVARFFLSVGAL